MEFVQRWKLFLFQCHTDLVVYFTEGVRAKVYFKAIPQQLENGYTFLQVDDVKMDFSVKDISMGVENVANGNSVIRKWKLL